MARKVILLVILLIIPVFSYAEEETTANDGLLPALCRQILSPDPITFEKIVTEVKRLPSRAVAGAMDSIENATESWADSLEETKSITPDSKPKKGGSVLGSVNLSNSLYDKVIDALALMLRNWGWSLSGLALIYITWRLYRYV